MQYEIITTEESFVNLEEEWNFLYKNVKDKTIYQTYTWAYSWWVSDKKPLYIIKMYDSNKHIQAIFPFIIDTKRTLRFIADIHTDYIYFLVQINSDSQLFDIFKTLKKVIISSKECSSIELNNITSNNEYFAILTSMFGHKQIIYKSNAYSYKLLKSNKNFMDSFDYMKSKKRSELKRIYTKNSQYKSEFYSKNDNFPYFEIKTIVSSMIEDGTRDKFFLDDTLIKVIEKLFDNDLLIIHVVSDKSTAVSMNFILVEKETYIFWIDIYTNIQNINLYSYLLAINLISQCNEEFIIDFGRGLYEYKLKNFEPNIGLQYTFFFTKKFSSFFIYISKIFLKNLLKEFYLKHKIVINKVLRR
jgi:hypothetical protein